MLIDIGITLSITVVGGIIAGLITGLLWLPLLGSPARKIIAAAPIKGSDTTETYLDVMLPVTIVLALVSVGAATIRPPTLTPYALGIIPVGFALILWTMISYPYPVSGLPLIEPNRISRHDYIWFAIGVLWYGITAGGLTLLLAANVTGTRIIF